MTWDEIPRELFFFTLRIVTGFIWGQWTFCRVLGVSCCCGNCCFAFAFLFFGGYRSVSFQSLVFRHLVILPVRNSRKLPTILNQWKTKGILAHLYMDGRIFKPRVIIYTVCCKWTTKISSIEMPCIFVCLLFNLDTRFWHQLPLLVDLLMARKLLKCFWMPCSSRKLPTELELVR